MSSCPDSDDPVSGVVHDPPAVFLCEGAALRIGEDVQHGLGWAAQAHAERRHDNRPVDQDGVGHHGVEQLVIGERRVAQAELQLLDAMMRSEEHTSELQSLMRISYAVFCLKKKTTSTIMKHAPHIQPSTHNTQF